MARNHRSPRCWLGDLIRALKARASTQDSKKAESPAVETSEPTSMQSKDCGNPGQSTESKEEPNIAVSANRPSGTHTHTSTNTDTGLVSEYHPFAVGCGATSVVDNLVDSQATTAAENGPKTALLTRPEISEVPPRDEESPIWLKSIERFKNEKPKEYKLMVDKLDEIRKLKDGDTWDTWLKSEYPDKAFSEMKYKWLRKCKAHMPSLTHMRIMAVGLSNLDPHKIAPLVTMGVFVLIELCFGLMDPAIRDKAMDLLSKTNLTINKWVSSEGDLRQIPAMKGVPSLQKAIQILERMQEGLDTLYFDSLVLMSSIHQAGTSRSSRFAASLISVPLDWERAYLRIQTRDSEYLELKSQVDSALRNSKEYIEALDWIGNRKDDPEPLHETVKERTGIDDISMMGGKWFVERPEFRSWVDGICNNSVKQRAFWVKGSMGTGKTTLLCRTVSEFEMSPKDGVLFVPYYCHKSGLGSGPIYETILRALYRRLAWNSGATGAVHAMQLYQSSKLVPDRQLTVKKTWERILKELITSSSTTIVFVLDAVDECQDLFNYNRLLEYLHKLPWTVKGPYFLVSSRPHVPVGKYFDGSILTFDVVQPETRNEMRNFIVNQLDSRREEVQWKESLFYEKPALLEELKSDLLESAGGMFRWVEIWLASFFPRNHRTLTCNLTRDLWKELKYLKTLENLPHDGSNDPEDDKLNTGLQDAYKSLWNINNEHGRYKDLQVRLFQIFTASFERLEPQVLLEAVCLDPNSPKLHENLKSHDIEPLYSGFLKVNAEGYLEYEHSSAKMYVEELDDSNVLTFSSKASHRTMSKIAILAMKQEKHDIWSNAKIDLVVEGAIEARASQDLYWHASCWKATDGPWSNLRTSRFFGEYLFRFWLRHCQMLRGEDDFTKEMGEFIVSAPPGFESWVVYQARRSLDWPTKSDKSYCNTLTRLPGQGNEALRPIPFLCMVSFGFSPVFYENDKPALHSGFEDSTVRTSEQKTALHIASEMSHTTIVKDLLELEWSRNGSCFALLSMKDDEGRIPLHLATDEDVVKTLLLYETGEPPGSATTSHPRKSQLLNLKDHCSKMIIHRIVFETGSEALVRWILQHSLLEPWALNLLFRHALRGVRWKDNGNDAPIARLLVDHGATYDGKEDLVKDFFNHAVKFWDLELLDLLPRVGVGIDTKLPEGVTALCIATRLERLDVVEFLLDRGADACAPQNPFGYTVLHVAAAKGNIKIAGLLLDKGAGVNAAGKQKDQDTPSEKGLSDSFRTSSTSCTLPTPLGRAVSRGHREMTEFLISKGADVNLLSTIEKTKLDTMLKGQG